MDNRYEIAEQNGMSREFADWFFDTKKAGCGNVWFMMMAAMWEGWKACRAAMLQSFGNTEQLIKHQSSNQGSDSNASWEEIKQPSSNCIPGVQAFIDAMIQDEDVSLTNEGEMLRFRRNSPVTPDGWVTVPKKLTAENGAKGVLSGEFSETKFINCPECFGDDDCETCDGSGRIEITVPVSWTNIKAIWAKGVEHFEAAPQQENI